MCCAFVGRSVCAAFVVSILFCFGDPRHMWSVLTYIRAGKRLGDGLTTCPQGSLLGHRNLQGEIRNIVYFANLAEKEKNQTAGSTAGRCLSPPSNRYRFQNSNERKLNNCITR